MGMTGFALAALVVFGVAYNACVGAMERRGWTEGYNALLVAGGVLVTLAGYAAVRGVMAAAEMLAFFAASGAPMLVGSAVRYARRREADAEAARERIL